jgi:hypothetical protein
MYTQPRLRLYPEERKDNAANAANAELSRRTRDRPGRATDISQKGKVRSYTSAEYGRQGSHCFACGPGGLGGPSASLTGGTNTPPDDCISRRSSSCTACCCVHLSAFSATPKSKPFPAPFPNVPFPDRRDMSICCRFCSSALLHARRDRCSNGVQNLADGIMETRISPLINIHMHLFLACGRCVGLVSVGAIENICCPVSSNKFIVTVDHFFIL